MIGSKSVLAVVAAFIFLMSASAAWAAAAPGEWSNIAPSNLARSEVQTAVLGGKIYVVGGNYFETENG